MIIKILSLPHPASFLFLLGLLQIFSFFSAGFCCLYWLLQKLVVESSRVSVPSSVVFYPVVQNQMMMMMMMMMVVVVLLLNLQ